MYRELPHSLEAEQSILGSMLIYPQVASITRDMDLAVDDFFLESHQIIFQAMDDLMESNNPIDGTSVISRLNDLGKLQEMGGIEYLVRLSDGAVSSANAAYYIDIVKNKAHLRRLIETAELIAKEGFDGSNELDFVMDKAEKDILHVTRSRRTTDFKSSRTVVTDVIEEVMRLRESKEAVTGVATGYRDLDRTTNGFQRGDLIILAARPSMGKTAFALNLALNASMLNSGAIAVFSLEMPAEALMKRILSAKSQIESSKLRTGFLKDDEFNQLNEAANEMMGAKLFIDDSASVKMAEIFSKCRKLKSEHGLDMVLIDYLQLISGSGKGGGDNRQQEVSEISRSLKALARELECPVIALSQLSRSVEQRQDKRPMLSDLRESGAIEQDADIVMFLYRDEYYNRDETKESSEDRTEVNIAKHRNGATRNIELAFNKSINAFFNYEDSDHA
ncbi:MAG: replicative DNA helicase [Erysipelotrichaceae bacterium]